ncbi:LysR family transcriptional regulator, partial [Achromobacter xylosoxidans]
RGLAAASGLRMLPCPVAMPGYAIEMGWRADALRDEAVAVVRRGLLGLLNGYAWEGGMGVRG